MWRFLAVLAAATIAQGVGVKLLLQLIRGTLPASGLAALAILVGAYVLLVSGLGRFLACERMADSPGP